jgi:hypothetical protein
LEAPIQTGIVQTVSLNHTAEELDAVSVWSRNNPLLNQKLKFICRMSPLRFAGTIAFPYASRITAVNLFHVPSAIPSSR